MYRRNTPQIQVSGAAALFLFPLTVAFGAVMTTLYLLILTFFMNLFGISIPVHV